MVHSLLLGTGAIVGIVVGAVAAVVLIIIIFWWSTYNKLLRLKNMVEEAWATIDVFLKKRFDLIPNLVETVKGYAKHESETMAAVVKARQVALVASTTSEKIDADKALTASLARFMTATRESYPDLKANANFMSLQNQLAAIEGELEKSRRYYNAVVRDFNTALELFPSNIVARRMRLEKRAYFELDSEEERKNVKVSF